MILFENNNILLKKLVSNDNYLGTVESKFKINKLPYLQNVHHIIVYFVVYNILAIVYLFFGELP